MQYDYIVQSKARIVNKVPPKQYNPVADATGSSLSVGGFVGGSGLGIHFVTVSELVILHSKRGGHPEPVFVALHNQFLVILSEHLSFCWFRQLLTTHFPSLLQKLSVKHQPAVSLHAEEH
jgi:hypothetical protein